MPLYSIQAPNGQTYEIEGPEGATQDQVIAEILRRDPSAGKPITPKGGAVGDIFTALKQGAVGSTKALTDIFGADNAVSSYLGQKSQALQQQYSPAAQEEMRQQAERMKAAEASGSTWEEIKAAAQNIAEAPLRSTAQGAGSLIPYLPTMLLGPMAGALKLAPRTVAALEAISETAPKVLGTAQGVGAVKGSVYDAVYQNELEATGNEQVARNKAQAAQNYAGKNLDQMIVGGVLGRIAGGTGAERLLTKAGMSEAAEKLAPRLLRAAGEEFITEGPQGAQERLAQNLALQREGVNVPTMQGVVGQGLQEGIIGALSAGPVAGLRGPDVAARRKEEERKRAEEAAQAAEAAKVTPEALRQLDTDYRTADQQLRALTEQMNAAKPKKGATDEEKAAYEQLKTARAKFINETYKPLRMEYDKRKDAITGMYETQQAEIEAGTAAQPTAKRVLPTDIGDFTVSKEGEAQAKPYQLTDVARLMHNYDLLRNQVGELETQLAAGPDVDTQTKLMEQRGQLMARMQDMAPVIEERGGVTDTEADFTKRMQDVEKERLRLLELGDFDAAAKQAEKLKALQARQPYLQELKDFRTKAGQTRDLFAEEPAQPEAEGLKYVAYPPHKGQKNALPAAPTVDVTPFAATKEQATPLPEVKPAQQAAVQTAQTKLAQAESALPAAAKAGNTETLYSTLDQINQAQGELSRANEEVGRPALKPAVLDIFSPANLFNTALQSGDTKLLNDLAKHSDRTALRDALNQSTSERERLVNALERRLDLGGSEKAKKTGQPLKSIKRERADLFSKQYDSKQQALFKNGTYPDKELQAIYDKGGPAAVEYENVMRAVEELSKKVTTKQGNAKESLYEQLVRTYAELERLNAQMESGIATPTLREKVATANAALGKGEAAPERQMDAGEKYQLQRKITGTTNKYNMLVGKITPIRDQILKLHDSLYTTTPLEKPSVVAEKKKAEAEAAAKGPKAMTRTARTAARLARGDVQKEAQSTTKMRNLARDLGENKEEYQEALADFQKRYAELKEKYGANDPEVAKYQQDTTKALNDLVERLGRKTPEYKAELKKQVEYMQQALSQSKQEVPTKRTGAVTRRQSSAPRRLVSSSPESKAASAREQEAYTKYRGSLQDVQEALASEKEGREEERFLRGVEVESLALKPEYVGMLERGDLQGVLSYLSKDKQVDEFSRTVAARLAPLLDVTKVQVKDSVTDGEGKPVLGAATSKLIELNRDGGLSVETLLHESTHAAAERVVQLAEQSPDKLTREQKLAINELKAIHARVRADAGITSKNAKGSLSEFVAEVMSNRNLQKQLAARKWRMSDMWKGIKSVIMRMLGFEKVETMFGASVVAVDQLFIPASTTVGTTKPETRTTRKLSAKDIAALHTGSNSMRQFADQFGDRIKQKDRTPEDVERIAKGIINEMIDSVAPWQNRGPVKTKSETERLRAEHDAKSVVALPTADTLDYKAMATMSDGTLYDENNPLHFVEAEPATFAAMKALEDPELRKREAEAIATQRKEDFASLASYFNDNYNNYTAAEIALVMKAAAKYAVLSSKDGKLRLAEIAANNRHNIAVVGKEGADAVIEQLRAGKGLKQAFLDGLQKAADDNAKNNARLNGWKKFDQAEEVYSPNVYTDEEVDAALVKAGITDDDIQESGWDKEGAIQWLIENGHIDDRTGGKALEQAAIKLHAGCAGTPWCTGAQVGTARNQIKDGDFYVYYKDGRPEVAVRMDGQDKVGEVRGNNPNQALDPEQKQIAEAFLRGSNFEGANDYLDELDRARVLKRILTDEKFDDYKELNRFEDIVGFEKLNTFKIIRLLEFSNLRGYMRQRANDNVVEQLRKRLAKLLDSAYENNYFVGADVRLKDPDEKIEVGLEGKKYVVNTATIKAAGKISLGYNEQDVFELPMLESAGKVDILHGELRLPKLHRVSEVTFYPTARRHMVLVLPKDAVIDKLDFYGQEGAVELKGAQTARVVEAPTGDVVANLPNLEYMRLVEPSVDHLHHLAKYESRNFVRQKMEAIDRQISLNREVKDMTPKEKTVFLDAMQDLGDVLGIRGFDARSLRESEDKARDWVDQLVDMATDKYTREKYYALNKKLNALFNAQEKGSSTLIEKLGTINAPNVIADAPYGQELTELPEERRFAPKDYGVQETSKGVFGFKPRRQPSDSVVAREPGIVDKVLGNIMGLAGRVQFVDQYAALDEAFKKGKDKGVISALEATNANYLLRFGQQRSQFAGQFLTNGPVKAEHTKKDGGVETVYRSTKGTSMMDVAQALNKAKLANETEQENMFTVYLAGLRAKQVGWDKLNFSNSAKAEAEYKAVMDKLNANKQAKDAFEEAAKQYQKYNAGLLDFLVDTGALSAKKAAELKGISYVPFYRINNNGEVQLLIDKEHPVRIANIKDEPQLQSLVGGNTAILPVFTSAAQNTFILTGMGLRNQAVKETAFALKKMGVASVVRQGKGPASSDVVRFKKNGEDYYALIDTDMYGVPANLIVRGMEGIKTTMPAVIKAMGIPANILRSFVVRNPAYAVRQIVRDPLNAWLTTGTDATPVLSAMKELASMVAGRSEAERKLMETGAISSHVYSGDEQDMAKFLKDLSAGKGLWEKALARFDAFALQGDAATRAVIYKDSLAKGMSEQEALLRTLESMNFSRRGVSPSMQALSVMIPFFNAQVQGLDVLYRAFKGDMPYSEQLKIREKLFQRGLLLAAGTLAYAAMMEDDEAYKRAKPEERYGNWFVHIPGGDEPVRVPIPFELGFLFKALPEAVYNMAAGDEKSEKAMSGLFKLAQQTNPFGLPQAVKPLTEAVLGKSFYGGDIESAREKSELATQRYREGTTELSKLIGSVTGNIGVSPITLDYLIRGYTAPLGIALVSLANPLLAPDTKAEIAQPTTKLSKRPFIGGLFQPVEGRGTLDEAYDRMLEIQQTKGTFDRMVSEGRRAEAQAFAQDYSNRLAATSVSGSVQKRLGELAKMERQIRAAPGLSTEQKDERLAQLDKAKVALARQFLAATDKTTRQ